MHYSIDEAFSEIGEQRGFDLEEIRYSYNPPLTWCEEHRSELKYPQENPEYARLPKTIKDLVRNLAYGLTDQFEMEASK